MEQLVQVFPSHPPEELQRHLTQAGGIVETAIETLLFEPPTHQSCHCHSNHIDPPADTAVAGPSRVEVHPGKQAHRESKRPRPHSIDLTTDPAESFLDLTQDSTDEEELGDDPLGMLSGSSKTFQPGALPLEAPPPAALPVVVSQSMPLSFEDFHNEQMQLHEERARKAYEIEQQRIMLVSDFVANARDMFEDISVPYLEKLMEETRPKITSEDELVDACIEAIFALKGQYPKASTKKRKRSDDNDNDYQEGDDQDLDSNGEGTSRDHQGDAEVSEAGSSSHQQRDYKQYHFKMSSRYETQCASQLYQDFSFIAAASIRLCLKKFNYHYAPSFDFLSSMWTDYESNGVGGKAIDGGIKLELMKKPRKQKVSVDPRKLDPEFRKELQWVQAKIAKELQELHQVEEEERNYKHYEDRNELMECGCCYGDVPPNRIAQCEDGHLFCLECSRKGAEVELGYRRTVLKCMSSDCPAVFSDSEAVKFLSRPVFRGLLRSRQQSELKMAGLDCLVECPFCTYAAIVENDQDREFRCQAPKCRKVSCRLCKAPTHIPQSCEENRKEQEKNSVLTAQHRVEEQMSQALIRECPKCKSRFFKTEGCNKMTCPQCHTLMCYICKQQIKDYSHFDQTAAGQAPRNPALCRLWDNTIERNTNDVKEAALKMLLDLQANKPDLAAQVRLDIPE